MVIDLDKLGECDILNVQIAVRPHTKVNFDRGNILLISKSPISNEESCIHTAEYAGKGIWLADRKTSIKKKSSDSGDTHE